MYQSRAAFGFRSSECLRHDCGNKERVWRSCDAGAVRAFMLLGWVFCALVLIAANSVGCLRRVVMHALQPGHELNLAKSSCCAGSRLVAVLVEWFVRRRWVRDMFSVPSSQPCRRIVCSSSC